MSPWASICLKGRTLKQKLTNLSRINVVKQNASIKYCRPTNEQRRKIISRARSLQMDYANLLLLYISCAIGIHKILLTYAVGLNVKRNAALIRLTNRIKLGYRGSILAREALFLEIDQRMGAIAPSAP